VLARDNNHPALPVLVFHETTTETVLGWLEVVTSTEYSPRCLPVRIPFNSLAAAARHRLTGRRVRRMAGNLQPA
jgi:hypothetical protein